MGEGGCLDLLKPRVGACVDDGDLQVRADKLVLVLEPVPGKTLADGDGLGKRHEGRLRYPFVFLPPASERRP